MPKPAHDLSTTHGVVQMLLERLFEPEDRRIQAWVDKLCKRHQSLMGEKQPIGFLFDGERFRPSNLGPGRSSARGLHESLYGEMETLIADRRQIQEDRDFISQVLFMLLGSTCQDQQEVRDALPECLVQLVPDYARMRRIKNDGFTIRGNPRAYGYYQEMLPKIEVYTVGRLFY